MTSRSAMLHVLVLLVAFMASAHAASSFIFDMDTAVEEECFLENLDARSSQNKLLFRFEILEPTTYDAVDVAIRSPTGRIVESWNKTTRAHTSQAVRESGVYHFCFSKLPASSRRITVSYAFDFLSVGSRIMTSYPASITTIEKSDPTKSTYSDMIAETTAGKPTKMAFVEFSLAGVSKGLVGEKTRIMLSFSVEYTSQLSMDMTLSHVKGGLKHPMSWESMEHHVESFQASILQGARAETGGILSFDVTDLVSDTLRTGGQSLAFSVQCDEDASARLSGMVGSPVDHWPIITYEEIGLHVMVEIAAFKTRVWDLKGQLSSILQNERSSRNVAESANSSVFSMNIIVNVVLVAMGVAQVFYVRKLLGSGY
ncbi:hypothetical protein SDRG_07011 [Saprolegnia diclina VS20]|uniref:GOLD domain-containing protein n=1 Tax=Saprolegnia diclina (strain VS20) TaxID=1156394 RepID=T0RTB2_SAPDV|nr:hypothetical protein SDRG_07011 [Saprolegnia diclina VS20]EQC35733.1 hypothetical protein SDRG_07011 [Saprolegnia diclina VS20]|eukprot:XP_008611050.1 hypothetical protein SDRG_07011 [Saprolegnia diclina VS20]